MLYCLSCKAYRCERCQSSCRRKHAAHFDSVNNHLTAIFAEWRALYEHAATVTQKLIQRNITQ